MSAVASPSRVPYDPAMPVAGGLRGSILVAEDEDGVRDSLEHVQEQTKPGLDAERMLDAVVVDGLAVDVFENEI